MNFLANKITNIFARYDYKHRDAELFKVGINIILRYLIFGLTILAISLLLNDIIYIFFFDLFLIILRRKLGGIHANKTYICFIISIITFSFIPYYFSKLTINKHVICLMSLLELLILYFIPPCKVNNRKYPSSFYNKMNFQKKIIIISYFILLVLGAILSKTLTSIICFSVLVNILSILFNQYKNYKKENLNENIF
ncbi:accessory gene regulator B family protein [Thomasclavelia spiroformis]|uniref:accessory gene regulator B family protein n=1 Tax=Thomasclavelia spiroformis TaxID=29348 RepID=UPI00241D5A79|nr:accessory gene regulator B family protein [Thomasclavelia spiroformis]MBS6114281.1 accessory gene regulator B family protein [Thomasclavelia spiroformis]